LVIGRTWSKDLSLASLVCDKTVALLLSKVRQEFFYYSIRLLVRRGREGHSKEYWEKLWLCLAGKLPTLPKFVVAGRHTRHWMKLSNSGNHWKRNNGEKLFKPLPHRQSLILTNVWIKMDGQFDNIMTKHNGHSRKRQRGRSFAWFIVGT
jgi:hypothetical protein